jgi:outer membrane protein OmpA-like peptidoglycan-associated protein
MAGCIATEEWTHDLFRKRQAEVENRFIKVETGAREQGNRLDKVEIRVDNVENRIADLENRGPQKTSSDLTSNNHNRTAAQRTLVAVVFVPFAFDRAELVPAAEVSLTRIVTDMRDDPHLTLDLEGTTDPVGTLDYNVKLSRRRVDAVKQLLLDQGIEPARILGATGRGPVLDRSVKNDLKRRVTVRVIKLTD